jgi:anoctamin-10
VTGIAEKYYPWKKQIMRYTENLLILIPILGLTFFILVLSLNLRGYVDPDHDLLFYPSIYYFSEEGKIFDKNTNWGQIPTIIHVGVLFTINMIYKEVAIMMTHREYHSSLSSLENSVLVKRFVFETFNTFTDLAYLAFVKFDIKALKFELISIFMFDEIRRVLAETLIPLFLKFLEKRKTRKSKIEEVMAESKYVKSKLVELTLPKYEVFDDYLEIILNLGYITLFASSFSLAPAIMFVFHLVERVSDRYKIMNTYQRPLPFKSKGIGSWHVVMNMILIVSVFSNITLFAFSSEKMMEFFPWMFQFGDQPHPHSHDENDNHTLFAMATMKVGYGRYVIMIIFIIEHILFIFIWIVKKLISKKKDWVDIYMNRKEYKFRIKMSMEKRKKEKPHKQGSDQNVKTNK